MTQPIRFFLDECLSHLVVERQIRDSLQLYGADAEVAHLLTKFPKGMPDLEWIPELSKEGGWIVISPDRGSHSKKDERLPDICREMDVTHVIMSAALHRRNMYYKALAITTCWPALLDAASYPAGTGFSLSLRGERFCFRKVSDAKSVQVPTTHQTALFDATDVQDEE
ncbi:MAG: hypothetical protein WCB27_21790 [Thermoguttaceae bacterium]